MLLTPLASRSESPSHRASYYASTQPRSNTCCAPFGEPYVRTCLALPLSIFDFPVNTISAFDLNSSRSPSFERAICKPTPF